jgi:hypothetical protein
VQGFDWKQAAMDRSQPASADAVGVDPALAGRIAADEAAAAGTNSPTENPPPGGSFSRSDLESMRQLGTLNQTPPSGTYSQDDIDRAKALSGLSKVISPELAQKLLGAMGSSGSSSTIPSSPRSDQSQSQSNTQSSGMPLGGLTQSSSSSSSSSNGSFGQFTLPNSNASSDEAAELIVPPRKKDYASPESIETRFEIVVVCRKNEILLHPGAYRLTGEVLRSGGHGSDSMLAREIRAMVRNREIVDPLIRQKPAIRFLVESQGAETFALARRQLLFSLPDWPVSLQVAGSQDVGVISRNQW